MFDFIKVFINAQKSKKIVCHSDLTIFGKDIIPFKNKIIYKMLDEVDLKQIYIPTFNLDTNSNTMVDLHQNPKGMGALSLEAIKLCNEDKALRTPNPIHSYTVVSNGPFGLPKCSNHLSFGDNSIFDFFVKNKISWLCLGPSPNEGFTIFHHFETKENVPYRKWITFKRKFIQNNVKHEVNYKYFSRNSSNYIQNFGPAVEMLVEKNIVNKFLIGKRYAYIGRSDHIADFIRENLVKNPYFLVKEKT